MSHPFGELAIPSIEVGFESGNHAAFWGNGCHDHSPSTTPTTQSPERGLSSRKASPKQSPRPTPGATESEEERRKSRKREQNRESQRNFRRRQENRVKFLESKTLELEANSRQLRAENDRLKTELQQAHLRNDELFAMMSMPPTPLHMPLDAAPPSQQQQQQQSQPQPQYSPAALSMPIIPFNLNEEHFYAPPAVMQESMSARMW